MGIIGSAYLREPNTEKNSEDASNGKVSFGASSMQGWRINQEDAHNCILDFDGGSFFAVYDGHGGFEVAKYTASALPDFLKNTDKYKMKDYENALIEAFLNFDDTIVKPEVLAILNELVKAKSNENNSEIDSEKQDVPSLDDNTAGCSSHKDGDSESDDEGLKNPELLRLEAGKPIKEIMDTYKLLIGSDSDLRVLKKKVAKEEVGTSSSSQVEFTANNVPKCDDIKTDHNNDVDSKPSQNNVDKFTESKTETQTSTTSDGIKSEKNASEDDHRQVNGKTDANVSDDKLGDDNVVEPLNISPNKKKSTKNDLDDSTEFKKFITEDISEEDDSEDDNFQPASDGEDEDVDDDDDNTHINLARKTLAKHFLKRFNQRLSDEDSSENDEDLDDEDGEEDEEDLEDENGEDEYDDLSELADDGDGTPGVDSGCTAVVALIKDDLLYVANAGDSRCVVSKAGTAIDMSEDHKPEDKLEKDRILNAGGSVSADGRVNGGLNLSRAIGDHCYKTNKDLPNTQQMVTALPDVRTLKIEPNIEFIVLACDGIWNSLSSQEVVDFIRPKISETEKLSVICEELFEKCLAPNTHGDGTGCDNMTCVIVKINHVEKHDEITTSNESTDTKNKISMPVKNGEIDTSTSQNGNEEKSISVENNEFSVTENKAQKRSADETLENDDSVCEKRQKTEDAIIP